MLLAEVKHFLQSEQTDCFAAWTVSVCVNDVCLSLKPSQQTLCTGGEKHVPVVVLDTAAAPADRPTHMRYVLHSSGFRTAGLG